MFVVGFLSDFRSVIIVSLRDCNLLDKTQAFKLLKPAAELSKGRVALFNKGLHVLT